MFQKQKVMITILGVNYYEKSKTSWIPSISSRDLVGRVDLDRFKRTILARSCLCSSDQETFLILWYCYSQSTFTCPRHHVHVHKFKGPRCLSGSGQIIARNCDCVHLTKGALSDFTRIVIVKLHRLLNLAFYEEYPYRRFHKRWNSQFKHTLYRCSLLEKEWCSPLCTFSHVI